MQTLKTFATTTSTLFLTLSLMVASAATMANLSSPVVDDFSHDTNNNLGIARQFFSDAMAGGKTTSQQQIANGIIEVKGEIAPPRGQPGWASTVLLLDPQGLPQDLSNYEGVSLRVKLSTGNLSLSANSVEVTNFDYHAAPIAVQADGQFHDVKIPFETMKRAWSEQTQLNKQSINSLSIVAFDMQKGSFDFAVDQVNFY